MALVVLGVLVGNLIVGGNGASAAVIDATPKPFRLGYTVPHGTPVAARMVASASSDWNAAAAQRFWTPARLAAATPATPAAPTHPSTPTAFDTTPPSTTTPPTTPTTPTAPTAPAVMAHSFHYSGSSSIGMIFYAGQNLTTHYCSAAVIGSPKGNLIALAAHCNPGRWMAFVPKYQHGASVQPYGIWAVTRAFVDSHYTGSTGPGSDYDYALAVVAPRNGQQIEAVTGGNRVTTTPGYAIYPTAVGYPKITADSTDKAIACHPTYKTQQLPGYRQMVLYCTGFYGGTSGGPWLLGFNGTTGLLVGLTGGYQAGGPNSWTTYSPIIDSRFFGLLQYAELHS